MSPFPAVSCCAIQAIRPAPGYRGSEGTLWYVGNGGYNWSSASYDSSDHDRGVYLNFYAAGLNPSNPNHCAYGLQLHCLSE